MHATGSGRADSPPSCSIDSMHESDELGATDFAARALKLGDRALPFALPDVRGKLVTLAEVLEAEHAVVAFYRDQ